MTCIFLWDLIKCMYENILWSMHWKYLYFVLICLFFSTITIYGKLFPIENSSLMLRLRTCLASIQSTCTNIYKNTSHLLSLSRKLLAKKFQLSVLFCFKIVPFNCKSYSNKISFFISRWSLFYVVSYSPFKMVPYVAKLCQKSPFIVE
jgi:hypothetical protein